jgi:phosphoadenosine phosphosulfate reductase
MSLVEETLFGTVDKVQMAIERLKTFEPPEGYYLAFSGGKDSQCIYHLAEMAGVKFDAHYNVTTIDPPELIYFIRKHYTDVIWERPEKPFLSLLPEKGFPIRQNRWCCAVYKERGGSGRRVVTGIRKAESNKRAGRKMVEQCYRDSSKTYINPIIDWEEDDVWEFIRSNNLPYCSLYDEGFKRIGCVMCPMATQQQREAERWPGMKKAFLKAFRKLYENRGHRPAFSRWKNGEEMFDWWIHDDKPRDNPDQTVMFE